MTHIIATLGPASESTKVISELYAAGADYFRLNFSHGTYEEQSERVHRVRSTCPGAHVVLDTRGPEIRTGDLPPDEWVTVNPGDTVTFVTDAELQRPSARIVMVNHPGITNDVQIGDELAVDSGKIMLTVTEVTSVSVQCLAKTGGRITSRRHINLIGRDISLPTITGRDRTDLEFGANEKIDTVALSYTRSADDIRLARSIIPGAKIWAKIENIAGMQNLREIIRESDGVMVARGDLGTELPYYDLPGMQEDIVRIAKEEGKFSIVATEMLETMIVNTRPTRAETMDIAHAVWSGASAIMLSAETAASDHPVLCVEVMKRIANAAKKYQEEQKIKIDTH
jgi:pyruvate kinase